LLFVKVSFGICVHILVLSDLQWLAENIIEVEFSELKINMTFNVGPIRLIIVVLLD
jgi:hypothetical protein